MIKASAEEIFKAFTSICKNTDDTFFFAKLNDKWSIAENVKHLIVSTNTTTLAFTLPAFLVRWIGGTPNRPSKTYEELVAKYKQKLAEGGAASGRFIPKPIPVSVNKKKLMQHWENAAAKFINAVQNKTTEKKLDSYLVKHPLLGRITLRELCYFTIYHTQHHQQIIKASIAAAK